MRTTMMLLLWVGVGCTSQAYEGPRRKTNETALIRVVGSRKGTATAGQARETRVIVHIREVDGNRRFSAAQVEVLPGYHTVKIRWERFQWIEYGIAEVAGQVAGQLAIDVVRGLSGSGPGRHEGSSGYWKRKEDGELTVRLRAEAGQLHEITDFTATPPRVEIRSRSRRLVPVRNR